MNKRILAVSLAVIALINIGVFIVVKDYSKVFWINYGFVMFAFLLMTYIFSFKSSKGNINENLNKGIPVGLYLICEIIAAFVCANTLSDSSAWVLVVHIIITGIFIIFYNVTISSNNFINSQQERRKAELMNFKHTIEKMKLVQKNVPYSAEYKKIIDKAYDAISSGQTESNYEVQAIENNISSSIDTLEKAVIENDIQKITSLCNEIENLSAKRDSILKLRNVF